MIELITGGSVGLLLGMGLQLCGLSLRENLRGMLAFSRRNMLRAVLGAAGLSVMLSALLTWLAVIDVDLLTILPLDGGTVIGGLLFGLAAGWTGATPSTALTGIGGGRLLESLCTAAGCAAGAVILSYAAPLIEQVRTLFPPLDGTWFRVKLDGPYLYAGGFLGLGCIGLVISVLALCIRPERTKAADAEPSPTETETSPDELPPDDTAADDTVAAILPGEEPLVVDTAEEPAAMEENAAEDADKEEMPVEETKPILHDHPELEAPPDENAVPDDADLLGAVRAAESGVGVVTPSQQAALPPDARVIDKAPPEENTPDEGDEPS